ncbi:MAG: alkyl sulfatase C-terminal domain-containing protein, partial [Streptosporangiaceae bacterium]
YRMELSNGVLIHYPTRREQQADLTLTLTRAQLAGLLTSGSLEGVSASGDRSILATLLSLTDQPDPDFAVVTP